MFKDSLKIYSSKILKSSKNILKYVNIASNLIETNVLKIIVKIDNDKLSSNIENFYGKGSSLFGIFALLKEQSKQNKDTLSLEKIYLYKLGIYAFKYETINEFCKILNKDKTYIVNLHIDLEFNNYLTNYIRYVCLYSKNDLEEIVPTLVDNYRHFSIAQYLEMSRNIISYSDKYIKEIIFVNHEFQDLFEEYIISFLNSSIYTDLIFNYTRWLIKNQPDRFHIFEQEFLKGASSNSIIEYVSYQPKCNKRLALKRLIELRNDENLAKFFNIFEEYQIFLPLL